MAGSDFEICDMRYWGLLMVPLLLLRKWTVRRASSNNDCVRQGFEPPGAFVHAVLRLLARVETALLHRPPMGSSLLLAARKKSQASPAGG